MTIAQLFSNRKQRPTVDSILQSFNQTVQLLEQVQGEAEAEADAAAALIAATETKRQQSLSEAGRAASVASKIKALIA